jgi:hypothetical protein
MIIIFIIHFFIIFILGYLISFYTGLSSCSNYISSVCFCKGFKQAFFSTIVYLIIFFVPFFKSGFIGLLGDTFIVNTFAEGFIMSLTNISLTIDNYFKSLKENCKLDFDLSAAAWKRIEKKLNSREKKDSPDKIEIKG